MNMYIAYKISIYINISSYPTLENCLFGAVSLTKNNLLININILDKVFNLTEKKQFQLAMDLVEIV